MLERLLERHEEAVQAREVGPIVGPGHVVAKDVPIEVGVSLPVVNLGIDVQPVKHPQIGHHNHQCIAYCNSRTEA